MLYIVRALVFLLETALAVAGVTVTLSAEAQPAVGGTLLGSAPALALPNRTLKLTRRHRARVADVLDRLLDPDAAADSVRTERPRP
jgi:hypothetical protein